MIDAFWTLSTARPIGFAGAGAIPITAIWAYSDRYECPAWFEAVIQAVDLDYLGRLAGDSDGR
jgi:hypothetical protein